MMRRNDYEIPYCLVSHNSNKFNLINSLISTQASKSNRFHRNIPTTQYLCCTLYRRLSSKTNDHYFFSISVFRNKLNGFICVNSPALTVCIVYYANFVFTCCSVDERRHRRQCEICQIVILSAIILLNTFTLYYSYNATLQPK